MKIKDHIEQFQKYQNVLDNKKPLDDMLRHFCAFGKSWCEITITIRDTVYPDAPQCTVSFKPGNDTGAAFRTCQKLLVDLIKEKQDALESMDFDNPDGGRG